MTSQRRVQQTEHRADTGLNRYVALLRAVNVGGHSVMRMDELRKAFEDFGLSDVTTYCPQHRLVFCYIHKDHNGPKSTDYSIW